MADFIRKVRVFFDRASAKKAEQELASAMGEGGKKAGENFARELKQAFDKRLADLKTSLAKGLISPEQFKKQAELAAKQFNSGIIKGMDAARKAGTLTDSAYIKLAGTLKRVGDVGASAGSLIERSFFRLAATLASVFSIRQAIRFFASSIDEAREASVSVGHLDSVLQALGLRYAQVEKEVESFTDQIQRTTRFSDEDARDALTTLITGTGDYRRSLELLEVVAKIAEKRQISMADAAVIAVKASKGFTKGLQDLTGVAKPTGDVLGLISKNLGDIAVQAGKVDPLKRLSNAWDELKEHIGFAVLGTSSFQESTERLIDVIGKVTKSIDDNKAEISAWVSGFVDLVKAIIDVIGWLDRLNTKIGNTFEDIGNFFRLGLPRAKELRQEREFREQVTGGASSTAEAPKPTGGIRPPGPEADKELKAKKQLTDLERERLALAHDIRIAELQIADQVSRQFAEDEVRLQELQGTAREITFDTLEDGLKRLRLAEAALALGFADNLQPQMAHTQTIMEGLRSTTEELNKSIEKVAANQAPLAKEFSGQWTKASELLEGEIKGDTNLIRGLSQAFAEGGFKGLAQYAGWKVKENLAKVIEETAYALGSLGLGNFKGASEHFASAAEHGAAAVAWKALAKGSGGGAGGGAAAGGGGGGGPSAGANKLEKQEQIVNIYLTGPGWNALNPEVQRVTYQSYELARERFGVNTKIRIHRGNG
jgi:hypothetical protein